jgi:hypothetical protein
MGLEHGVGARAFDDCTGSLKSRPGIIHLYNAHVKCFPYIETLILRRENVEDRDYQRRLSLYDQPYKKKPVGLISL